MSYKYIFSFISTSFGHKQCLPATMYDVVIYIVGHVHIEAVINQRYKIVLWITEYKYSCHFVYHIINQTTIVYAPTAQTKPLLQ